MTQLDWNAFSAQYFPGRGRHDLDAVAAYGAYRQGRDWPNSGADTPPPKLTLVPDESPPAAESDGIAVGRLLDAVAAEQAGDPHSGRGG